MTLGPKLFGLVRVYCTGLKFAKSNVTFNGTTRVVANSNGGVSAESSRLVFEGDSVFDSNSDTDGGALNCQQGTVHLRGHILFADNKADRNGGALYAAGTSIYMKNQVNFTLNAAFQDGGAMYLESGATLTMEAFTTHTHLSTLGNSAHRHGGGIYHVDIPTIYQCSQQELNIETLVKLPYCFLQVEPFESIETGYVEVSSHNDMAGVDGSFLYGGLLDRCRLKSQLWDAGIEILTSYGAIAITSSSVNRRRVTSKPYDLCFCRNNDTDIFTCTKTLSIEVYSGQIFSVSLLAIAQMGTTSTLVTAITSSRAKLEIYQTSQLLPGHCYPLSYTLYSTQSHEEVILYPNGPCRDNGQARVVINATLLPCPDGFSQDAEICTCEERLQRHDVNCTITDDPFMTKTAGSNFWMGALYLNTTYRGLILGAQCPIGYCVPGAVNITLDNPDVQCDHHRTGLLCSACATNYSLMLGSFQCNVCANTYLAVLLPFAAAGIALVIFLTFLRLTIVTGSLNSVILYANIIQANRRLYFPSDARNILTVFIAWMNLDFGFQTCFYDGLDAYALTWLQFAFPFYMWILIGLMIIISRYSIMVSKLMGHNPIAVLATLLLMSYMKILSLKFTHQ
jgi:predicted outer membrane repeat protein